MLTRLVRSTLTLAVAFSLATVARAATAAATDAATAAATEVPLHWLGDKAPATPQPVAFGVPWKQGEVHKDTPLTITDGAQPLPTQSWPLAYWPDGSIKWTAFTTTTNADHLSIIQADSTKPSNPVTVTDSADAIEIKTGDTTWTLAKKGESFITAVTRGNTLVAKDAKLTATLEDRSDYADHQTTRILPFTSEIDSATVEQSGPDRAVVKFTGEHHAADGNRALLPFTLRLYFSAGAPTVHLVHTFLFDGDQHKDFIQSLAVTIQVPLREEFHNRHIRFIGDTGAFAEPVRNLVGRRNPSPDLYEKQVRGQRVPNLDQLPGADLVKDMAVWDDYKLSQISPDSWEVTKRTNTDSAPIRATAGHRSLGAAFAGDVSGGLAISLRDFWQLAPTALEITGMSKDTATLTAYLYSPDAPAMDLRHYDTKGHDLIASYEDYQGDAFSNPTGIARTHELFLTPFTAVPSNADLTALAHQDADPARIVCSPDYYHACQVFGVWSLPDTRTPSKKFLEDQLNAAVAFYEHEVDQRHWYGFWDYGDVMHTYDTPRHEWRYDIGGYAWANTELVPDMWLWYSFLRTGRKDVFTMAEAMTRHTQEVDVYHLGKFKGLGSRHNVRHWGDGAKEMRIGQAALKRFYYYLTTDERTGDLITESYDTDQRLADVDPLREVEPGKIPYPTHIRVGPDWFAACGNWMTAWERTGDTKYRDYILTGMKDMANMPHGLFSGDSYGYDPATHHLYLLHKDQISVPHLAALMGGPEVMMELTPLIHYDPWTKTWLNYCQYLQAPRDQQIKALGGPVTNARGEDYTRMTAWAANHLHDQTLANRAWSIFLGHNGLTRDRFATRPIPTPDSPTPMQEVPDISTNDTSQYSLNLIELLQLVPNALPETPNK